jgi:hypothetical protein
MALSLSLYSWTRTEKSCPPVRTDSAKLELRQVLFAHGGTGWLQPHAMNHSTSGALVSPFASRADL